MQAHKGDTNGIATAQVSTSTDRSVDIIASCGRDRTVQISRYSGLKLELLQTLDDHTSNVSQVGFLDGFSFVISISSDRTVMIWRTPSRNRQSIAYTLIRIITLKSCPISFACVPKESNVIVVSTVDKQIQRYDIETGQLLGRSKAIDPDTNGMGAMNSMEISNVEESEGPAKVRLLLGVCSSDKSIRVYDFDSGLLLAQQSGQSTISAVKVITANPSDQSPITYVVNSSFNGTVMIWELSSSPPSAASSHSMLHVDESPSKRRTPPSLKRVLSRTNIYNLHNAMSGEGDYACTGSKSPLHRLRQKPSRSSMYATTKSPKAVKSTPLREDLPEFDGFRSSAKQESTLKGRKPSECWDAGATEPNALNVELERTRASLRLLSRRIATAANGMIDTVVARDLCNELTRFGDALSERAGIGLTDPKLSKGNDLDDYLSRLIDQKLALHQRPEES